MDGELDAKSQVRLLLEAIERIDPPAVRKLLANGCPTGHPEVSPEPLQLALRRANGGVIAALLDAGAQLTPATGKLGIGWVVMLGRVHTIEDAFRRGVIPMADINAILFEAVSSGSEAVATRMLELGADPMHYEWVHGRKRTIVGRAAMQRRDRLTAAILTRLTQADKDSLLHVHVRQGDAEAVQLLLGAGADAAQRINGRSLLQLAPRDAHDVKRMLRSFRTGASIESAMAGDSSLSPAPAKTSLTL